MKSSIFSLFLIVILSMSSSCSADSLEANFGCGEGLVQDCGGCTAVFDPVCGCDNQTYSNVCQANCNGVYDYTNGACP